MKTVEVKIMEGDSSIYLMLKLKIWWDHYEND